MTTSKTTPQAAPRAQARRPGRAEAPAPERGIFCSRTLNLRSIKAIGYDMDYTLIHYWVRQWELRSYEHVKAKLLDQGWPVAELTFDPELTIRGLIIDTELGNIVKANRFGYIKRTMHGTRMLDYEEQRQLYSRVLVDLAEDRFAFLNTLFEISEACMFAQLVDLLDQRRLPVVLSYGELYRVVRSTIDEAHMEGLLKAEIISDPDRFVNLDPELPLALLDQRRSGKKLLLITNSEWSYTRAMMSYAFDRFLPEGSWSDLFDLVIVSARKPLFFSGQNPLFEVISEDGLLRPAVKGHDHRLYLLGNAGAVEQLLGCSGDEILYVGDHIYHDVHLSKSVLRWRTAMVLRELETEIAANKSFQDDQQKLSRLMARKEELELAQNQIRLMLQRLRGGYGPQPEKAQRALEREAAALREEIAALDSEITPLAIAAGVIANERWGPLMRAGNDKSHLAKQLERHADVYMSRVSNFLRYTPFAYFRSPRGSLPHDP